MRCMAEDREPTGLTDLLPTVLEVTDDGFAPDPAVPPKHVYIAYSKFFHESFMKKSANRTDLGIKLLRVDLQGKLPPRR